MTKELKKNYQNIFINKINWKILDLVFLSLPNGEAQKLIKKTYFKNKNIKFIDLSADFRITNLKTYEKNYNIKHKAKELIKTFIYSIPEFKKKKLIILELFQIQDVIQLLYKFH